MKTQTQPTLHELKVAALADGDEHALELGIMPLLPTLRAIWMLTPRGRLRLWNPATDPSAWRAPRTVWEQTP